MRVRFVWRKRERNRKMGDRKRERKKRKSERKREIETGLLAGNQSDILYENVSWITILLILVIKEKKEKIEVRVETVCVFLILLSD